MNDYSFICVIYQCMNLVGVGSDIAVEAADIVLVKAARKRVFEE